MIIFFVSIEFIFLAIILLAVCGVYFVINHLYNIALILTTLMGIFFLIGEISEAISKRRKIYILNAFLGGAFFLVGFEVIYETLSLINGSTDLLKVVIYK